MKIAHDLKELPAQSKGVSVLSPARRRLVHTICKIGFGAIERLQIRDGEPVWDPPPEITRSKRFGCATKMEQVYEPEGIALKKQFIELFAEFDRLQNFSIMRLQFQNGVPLEMKVKEEPV